MLSLKLLGTGFIPEIVTAYGGLRASMRTQMARGYGEERLLALVFYGCFIVFLSFLPRLFATDLSTSPDQSIAGGIIMWFFVVMFFFPLVLYAVGAISHLIAKAFGARGGFFNARHALFWMLAVLSPALISKAMLTSVLLQIGGTPEKVGIATLNAILIFAILRIWGAFLAEADDFSSAFRASATIASVFVAIAGVVYLVT